MAAVIGSLRANLSAGWAEFKADMGKAADSVRTFSKSFKATAADLKTVGATMTGALTVPIALFGASVVDGAKNYEASMNRVKAATLATGEEIKALNALAREIGVDPKNTASAIEAADAMEILAKNGLNVAQIMGGAVQATTKLAAATGAELAPAADVATDVMLQFGKQAKDLDAVVDGITGTLLASKFGFEDYALALGQGGGVAGGLGVEFDEFNAVIAATSALFSSGSDAGTSFKTFLTSLSGNSKEAKDAIKAYGLEFYDAEGNMRSMVEITGELETKLGGLNDQAKTEVLKRIFGTDAIRTAIGLISTGSERLAELDKQIAESSAQTQMDARMAGLGGALKDLANAFLELRLAIAESGLLDFLTMAVKAVADLTRTIAGLPGPVLAVGTVIAGLTAALGPAIFAAGAFMTAFQSFAPIMAAAGAGIMRFAALIPGLTAALGGLRVAMAFLLGPWGLAIMAGAAAVAFLVAKMMQMPPPTKEATVATQNLQKATTDYEEAARLAASASGEDAKASRKAAEEKRKLAIQTRDSAKAHLEEARSKLAAIQADNMRRIQAENMPGGNRGDRPGLVNMRQGETKQLESNIQALTDSITAQNAAIEAADATLAASLAGGGGGGGAAGVDLSGGGGRGGRGRQGPTVQELEQMHRIEVARLRNDWATVDALEAQDEIRARAKSYKEAGLSAAAAQAKAEGEVAAVVALRNQEYALNLEKMAEAQALSIAQLDNDFAVVQRLQDQADKRARILEYQREGLDLAEATRRAEFDATQIAEARARARVRWAEDDKISRDLANAQARGDDAEVERLREQAAIRSRILELQREQLMSPEAARAQAEAEAADLKLSTMIGKWRKFSAETYRSEYTRGMEELNRLLAEGVLTTEEYEAAVASLRDTLHKGLETASPLFKEWSSSVDLFGDALTKALTPGADLKSIWAEFRAELFKLLILTPMVEKLKTALKGLGDGTGSGGGSIFDIFKGTGSGGGGGILERLGGIFSGGGFGGGAPGAGGGFFSKALSFGSKLFGGFRANGGSVLSNRAYIVGERGPELFSPGVNGSITSNEDLARPAGAGVTIPVSVTVDAKDAVLAGWVEDKVRQGVQQAIEAAVPLAIRGAAEVVPEEMARRSQNAF